MIQEERKILLIKIGIITVSAEKHCVTLGFPVQEKKETGRG